MKYILAVANDGEQLLRKIHLPINAFIYHRSSIREAARLVQWAIPDLVLLEHTVPDGSGLMVVEALRSQECGQLVPVVVLGAEDPDQYERLGGHYFLPAQPKDDDLNRILGDILCNPDSTRVSDLPHSVDRTRSVDSA